MNFIQMSSVQLSAMPQIVTDSTTSFALLDETVGCSALFESEIVDAMRLLVVVLPGLKVRLLMRPE